MQLTIFTPTYNREKYLTILYNSLKEQSNKSFQWVVVDDGSSDGTDKLIEKFKQEKKINIEYYKQVNSGKHIAHNKGVELCNTELFFCVDSDDYLPINSVEYILSTWNNSRERDKSVGIVALKGYSNGNIMGNNMPKKIKKSTLSDLYNIYGKKGEMALIFNTKYLKENLFPVFRGEKFLSEEVLYNELDNIGPLIILDKLIYIMEYLDTGITRNYIKAWRSSPNGVICLLKSRYTKANNLKGIKKIYNLIKVILVINSFCIDRNISILKNTPNRILSSILVIPSFGVFFLKFKKNII